MSTNHTHLKKQNYLNGNNPFPFPQHRITRTRDMWDDTCKLKLNVVSCKSNHFAVYHTYTVSIYLNKTGKNVFNLTIHQKYANKNQEIYFSPPLTPKKEKKKKERKEGWGM